MIVSHSDDGYTDVLPGVRRKTLSYGEKTLLCEFRLQAGFSLPAHDHPHEQTGYLVTGRLRLTVGGETREILAGDSWAISGGVSHGADVLEDAVAIEVFSPVREDFVPAERA